MHAGYFATVAIKPLSEKNEVIMANWIHLCVLVEHVEPHRVTK